MESMTPKCVCGKIFDPDEGQLWCSWECWKRFCIDADIDPRNPFAGFVPIDSPEGCEILERLFDGNPE